MKIAIDIRMLHKAGIRRYSLELVESLSRIDRRNQYAVYLPSRYGPLAPAEPPPNFRYRLLDSSPFSLKEQFQLRSALKEDSPDVFHTTFDFGVPLFPVPKVVVTVHDAFFGPVGFFRNRKTRLYYQQLTKWSVRRSAAVIAVSDYMKRKIFETIPGAAGTTDKIKVVPNGVGSEFTPIGVPGEAEILKKKYSLPGKYILAVGSFASPIKNLGRLLDAYASLPAAMRDEYRLAIAGELLDRVPEAWSKIRGPGLSRHVSCLGYVPDGDLPALYRNAECFVFPSLHEGFGIPILEAMACGTPVITSNLTAMPEITGNAALLVDPNDVNEIRLSLMRLLPDGTLKKNLSGKGLERSSSFSWRSTALRTLAVYREVHGEKSPTSPGPG